MSSIIQIKTAVYASVNQGLDVTAICQGIVDTGNDDITADNATFTDPDFGFTKYFTILYVIAGVTYAKGCQEGTTIDLVP